MTSHQKTSQKKIKKKAIGLISQPYAAYNSLPEISFCLHTYHVRIKGLNSQAHAVFQSTVPPHTSPSPLPTYSPAHRSRISGGFRIVLYKKCVSAGMGYMLGLIQNKIICLINTKYKITYWDIMAYFQV